MSKALIIAEKPSVAADIARAIGGFTKQQDFFESDRYVLSSAVGHLLELKAPESHDVKRGKWTFTHLPVIPPHFELAPIAKAESRLKVLLKLLKRKDVGELINACDAGREGELIFRYIVQAAKARQPVRRLWLQSMTPASIREAFETLRSDDEMLPLADAARSRSEADWLVGINGTRAMTAFNSKEGGFYLTTVGRVQTPTLAIVAEREDKIRRFVSRNYWEVRAKFDAKAGQYEGRWLDETFKKSDDPDARAERLWEEAKAAAIVAACTGKPGDVSEESKPSTQLSPLLFDLTSLQREGNSKFGFSAKTTLSIAQALYEKHKVLTYPRTDARALPEDYLGVVSKTMQELGAQSPYKAVRQAGAEKRLGAAEQADLRQLEDLRSLRDHPDAADTGASVGSRGQALRPGRQALPRGVLPGSRVPRDDAHHARRRPRVQDRRQGAGRSRAGSRSTVARRSRSRVRWSRSNAGEKVQTAEIESVALATRPPPRYTEATLLTAMEGAGKLIEDDELRAAMAGKGLGTPATRAQIIENLIDQRYMVRDGKDLRPTRKAFDLMTLLKGLDVPELTAPELTGRMGIQAGTDGTRPAQARSFHARDRRHDAEDRRAREELRVRHGADRRPGTAHDTLPEVRQDSRRELSPLCLHQLRLLDSEAPRQPLARGRRGRRTAGQGHDRADVGLHQQNGPAVFGRAQADARVQAGVRLRPGQRRRQPRTKRSTSPASSRLGPCPKCGGRVFEQPMNYLCERATGPAKTCDFRSGKVILQQPIERAQMEKLLNEGRTDVLRGFISNRTRRKFSAFLVRKPDGTVGFEFEPRTKTAAKAPARARAAAPEAPAPASAARTTKSASRTAAAGEEASPAKTTRATAKRAGKVAAKRPAKSAAKTRHQDRGAQGRQVGGLTHAGRAPRSAGCGRGPHPRCAHPRTSVRATPALGYARRMQRFLIIAGIVAIALGVAWPWLARLGLGRLPGDLHVERDGFSFYFPLTTSIVVSIVVSLLIWLFRR